MQELAIRMKCEAEQFADRLINGFTSSGYEYKVDTIALVYWKKLGEDKAFKCLIADVDHEITHRILKKLISLEVSMRLDYTTLQRELAVGLTNSIEYNILIDLVNKPVGVN